MKRYAVILGSSGGIGEAVSRKLAADGWSLYLHYNKNEERVSELKRILSEVHPEGDFQMVQADLSDMRGPKNL